MLIILVFTEDHVRGNDTNGNRNNNIINGNNGGSNGEAITVAPYNAVTCIAIGSNNWIAIGV